MPTLSRILVPISVLCAVFCASARAAPFENVTQGAVAGFGIGTTPVGDFLLGEAGVQSAGVQSFSDRKYLLSWDGLLALKGGVLAAAHPYTPLVGGHLRVFAEGGRRFAPEAAWSSYLGVRLATDLQVMWPPGTGLSGLDEVNDIGGVGDVNLAGAVRLAGGASLLTEGHALLLTAFVQENGRTKTTNIAGAAFTDVGLAARFDLVRSLVLEGELFWGTTPTSTNAALGIDDRTTHAAGSVLARKIFGNGMWFSAAVAYAKEHDGIDYTATKTHFDTTNAPTFTVTFLYGFPLGAQAWP